MFGAEGGMITDFIQGVNDPQLYILVHNVPELKGDRLNDVLLLDVCHRIPK
jgi:hypothetical protein